MITLPSKAEFKAKALAALNAGELQCQQENFHPNIGCEYSGPCIIGSVLTPEERQVLDDYSYELSIENATLAEGLIEAPTWIEVVELQKLQELHDKGQVNELRATLEAL